MKRARLADLAAETMPAPRTTTALAPALALAHGLEHAAAGLARLDQALAGHPLVPAFLYRARLDAVRRQAAVDGQSIDPWHLAALLEGLRLRLDDRLRIIDRGSIFEAGRHALTLHQWLTAPDFDQEGEVQNAALAFGAPPSATAPLLTAARAAHAWLAGGGARPPLRAALIRHWTTTGLLRVAVPLTAPRALRPGMDFDAEIWVPSFLNALGDEAADQLQLWFDLEQAWRRARGAVGPVRSTSRAVIAIDILAAAPVISASSLAAGLGMAVNNATALLDRFCADGIAVEVTHRTKRRLFGLTGMAPLRDQVAPPRRPEPGRGRGRPPLARPVEPPPPPVPVSPSAALSRSARANFDFSDLDAWMAQADLAIRQTRRTLERLATAPRRDDGGDGSLA